MGFSRRHRTRCRRREDSVTQRRRRVVHVSLLSPWVSSNPAGRIGEPEEVAGVVAFLMSVEAAYVTRQVIGVNGGLV
jgi:NAD(P)-dependent dehydrogenase (short-subunit alcohol dehydrogenase family)